MAEKDTVWQDRYQALCGEDGVIKKFRKALSNKIYPAALLPDEKAQEQTNLEVLVDCLYQFAKDQFNFFYDGFEVQETYKLGESTELPKQYVFSVTLEQIGEDLELIRRMADQRLSDELGSVLKTQADKLVWSALKPIIKAGILPEEDDNNLPTTVMTYYQKDVSIRVIPYAPVALIGIPFTAPKVTRDYLGIPHEVGHYVYRRGRTKDNETIPQWLGKSLLELPEPSPKYVRRWKEEIFADVYGCLVGGPVVAKSFLDRAFQTSRAPVIQTPGEYFYGQFTEDDGIHPVPILRPLVYIRILEKMNLPLAPEFRADWSKKINGIAEFRSRYASANYVDIGEEGKGAQGAVEKVVDKIFDFLVHQGDGLREWLIWSGSEVGERFEELYSNFGGAIETIVGKVGQDYPPLLRQPKNLDNLWKNWVEYEHFFPGFNNAPPDKSITIAPGKAQRLEELEQEPRYTWNHLFLAGGWNTKGPGQQGSGVVFPKNWQAGSSNSGGSGYQV